MMTCVCLSVCNRLLWSVVTQTVLCEGHVEVEVIVIEVVINWTLWSIFRVLGFVSANFLHICVMIIAGLLIFQALI